MNDLTEDERVDGEIHRSVPGSDPFSAAVRATRMPMLITDPRQHDNPIVFVNDAFAVLTGYSREETLGRNCRFLQGVDTDQDDIAKVRGAIGRRVPIEIELRNYRKDGTPFWNKLLISPVFDGGELTYFVASQFDVTREKTRVQLSADREALEAEIRSRLSDLERAEERLRFTLKAGRLGAWTLDLRTHRLVASALCKTNFGRGPADTFTYDDLQAAIVPEDFERWKAVVGAALTGDGILEIDYRIRTPEDELRWIEVRGQTSFGFEGAPISMSGVSLDITQRKQAELHRDLLTNELDHRIKNTLATVQAMVGQTLRGAASLAEARAVVMERIQAMASAHDVLTSGGWSSAPLREVVSGAMRAFRDRYDDRIKTGGTHIELSARAATAMSLALHELATNAVKYGALSNGAGQVIVNWFVERDIFTLTWQELGGPDVLPPTRTGFGSKLIQEALGQSLRGEAAIDYRPSGILFRLATAAGNLKDEDPSAAAV